MVGRVVCAAPMSADMSRCVRANGAIVTLGTVVIVVRIGRELHAPFTTNSSFVENVSIVSNRSTLFSGHAV